MEMNRADKKELKLFNRSFLQMIAGTVALHVTIGAIVAYNLSFSV